MAYYLYRCDCGQDHLLELPLAADKPTTSRCPHCQQPANRVWEPTPTHFKGTGFYKTDSKRR